MHMRGKEKFKHLLNHCVTRSYLLNSMSNLPQQEDFAVPLVNTLSYFKNNEHIFPTYTFLSFMLTPLSWFRNDTPRHKLLL